jgi:hypothetical protein
MILEKPKSLTIVLGMHRSGTSAYTRLLREFGLEFGNDLYEADEYNPKGYFENLKILNFNEKLIKKNQSAWYSINTLKLDNKELAAAISQLQDLIQSELIQYDSLVLKDPRIPFLKQIYLHALKNLPNVRVQFLCVFRKPEAVAESLYRRDGLTNLYSDLLWLRSNLNILKMSQEFNSCFVEYDELFNNFIEVTKRIEKRLKLVASPTGLEQYTRQFLDRSLAHNLENLSKSSRLGLSLKVYNLLKQNSIQLTPLKQHDEETVENYLNEAHFLSQEIGAKQSLLERSELRRSLSEQENLKAQFYQFKIDALKTIEDLEQSLLNFSNSKSWRYTKFVRDLKNKFTPKYK